MTIVTTAGKIKNLNRGLWIFSRMFANFKRHEVTKRASFFIFTSLKIYYDVLSCNMSKLFVAPNRKAIEEPKEVLTYNLCQLMIFFNRVTERWRHFCVRCTKFSECLPLPTRFWTREKGTCSQDILVVKHDTGNMFNTLHLFIPANDLN